MKKIGPLFLWRPLLVAIEQLEPYYPADSDGYTPLMRAAYYGHEECVRLLLQAGADLLKMGSDDGFQAVHAAARGGSAAVVKTLLAWGADINSLGGVGMSLLETAAQHGNVDVIRAALDAGAAIDVIDKEGRTALHHAAYFGYDHAMKALLSAHPTLEIADLNGATALILAAYVGEDKCVRLLLNAGADIAKVGAMEGRQGFTALYAAASRGEDEVVSTLLSWGADVDTKDSFDRTALFAAVSDGQAKTVKLLLDAGADPHIQDRDNTTALMHTIDLPTVKVMLEAGLSATAVDVKGNTALHYACWRGSSTSVICAIFKAGANPTLLNRFGHTAAQVARAKGHNDAATLLDMLATKYTQTENSCLEAKEEPSSVVAELGARMSSCVIDDTVEFSQATAKVRQHRVLRPCLNCQNLTHRRCARCRTAYLCSHDCQVATLAEHRVECLHIHGERERAKAEQENSG